MNALKQTIRNTISLNIPDNHVRSVTPALLREVLEQMLDFSEETVAGGFQDISTTEDFSEWDIELGNKAKITLGGDVELSIINPLEGGIYWFIVKQDSTGGHNILFPSNSIFESGEPVAVKQEPGAVSIITVLFDGTNYTWLGSNGNNNATTLWQQTEW